jgi:hypothetical protein
MENDFVRDIGYEVGIDQRRTMVIKEKRFVYNIGVDREFLWVLYTTIVI